jgi:maltose O-acetyltransferase
MGLEKEKMLRGELYNPLDPELVSERQRARLLFRALNDTKSEEPKERSRLIKALIPHSGENVWIEPPFYCDYGTNIVLGDKVFFNFNCVVLAVMPVQIGSGVLFGPAVQVYTATHPLSITARRAGLEFGKAVTIGDDVWIGGGAIICPGVTIGATSIIGAGSVVTKSIPEGVVAAGNPCRVLKEIDP